MGDRVAASSSGSSRPPKRSLADDERSNSSRLERYYTLNMHFMLAINPRDDDTSNPTSTSSTPLTSKVLINTNTIHTE